MVENNCHVFWLGFACFGQVSVEVCEGVFCPVSGYFKICLPSADVMSDSVSACK